METDENFFADLPSFANFGKIARDDHYRPVPTDWTIFVTDVVDSTKAIEEGRYRDVNKVGAGSITTVREALDGLEFPFSFGGDGATLIVPPGRTDRVKNQLLGLRKLAEDRFDLDLRVGSISVEGVLERDVKIEVAKLELSPGREIAIFRGGGVSTASDLIKEHRSRYAVEGETAAVELTGLSCRWRPIPAEQGNILTLLVKARSRPAARTYDRVINELDGLLRGGLTGANPVNPSRMAYKTLGQSLRDEMRYHPRLFSFSFLRRVLEISLAVMVFKFGFNPGFFDPEKYQKALRTHSDYRKFDDMLRLIVDCSEAELNSIESYLESEYSDGTIFFGLQRGTESLMTCYVESLEDGDHLHFVDGGSGGYVSAARQLKDQVRESAAESSDR